MTTVGERLTESLHQIAVYLPAFIGAGLILVAGYFLARMIERFVDAVLKRLNFNEVAHGRLTEAMGRTGTRLDPVHAVGKLLFWMVMLLVILLASAALGLDTVNPMFATMVSYLPTVIASVVIIILGMIVGEFVRGIVLASAGRVQGVPTLAVAAKTAVVVIAVFMAMQQMGVAPELITSAFTLIFGAIALAAGLAFGLGNKDLAGEITRRWYENRYGSAQEPEPPGGPPNEQPPS
jgi:uncharacterized oligopeptide transporter (OPT) family protein